MKKIYTIFAAALCFSGAANAQRLIDLKTSLVSPAAGTVITSGTTQVQINAVVKNIDTDTLLATDTIVYQYLIDNQVMTITIGSVTTNAFGRTGKKLAPNDTVQLNRSLTITFPASLNGTHSLCVRAFPRHLGSNTVTDPVMTNNDSCVSVTLTGGLGVNEVTGNADENLVTNVYPVPAQNVANINIVLANKSSVTVKIADLVGRNISVQEKGSFHKGQHMISVNTSSLPTGIYLYQVIMNDQVSTGKLVIAK